MTKTTPIEEVLLAGELDATAAIATLHDAAANAEVPALSLLERCLAHSDAAVRAAAVRTLASSRTVHVLRTLLGALNDRSDLVVEAAVEAALHGQEPAPSVLVAFDEHPVTRRAAARRITSTELLYLLLADSESRAVVLDRLQSHRPLVGSEPYDTILRTLLANGMLPPADAAALFRNDPDAAGLLALQMVRSAIDAADGEPEIVHHRPGTFRELLEHDTPAPFAAIIEWLDATPGSWLALLSQRETVLDGTQGSARTVLTWQSLAVHAARLHAMRNQWNAEALIVETTILPWLLLAGEVPLDVRRDALRGAAGTTEQNGLRFGHGWNDAFFKNCMLEPVSCKSSGARDLRAVYALLDVHAGGQPLRALDSRLGKEPIVRAARDGAADLAWMIARSKWRGPDHLIAMTWLEALASASAPAFVEVTKTLPLRYWKDIPSAARDYDLDELLGALAASDAPSAVWSAWASAITGTGPSVSTVLESRGYRAVRPSTALFPQALSPQQEAEAKRLGVPPLLEHIHSGIVLVLIPGGDFLMGANDLDPDAYPRERPVRKVSVDTHYLAVTPVTQAQWVRAQPDSELPFRDGPAFPARGINWKNAREFLAKLNCGMRLPREAEWEYGARAGSPWRYWWGNAFAKGKVNCQDELSTPKATTVGTFPPNAWGLVDILGNVWEWCEEWFTDPMFPAAAHRWRVLRGGSWFAERWNARVTERFWGEPEGTDPTGVWGFRPAADLAICFGE